MRHLYNVFCTICEFWPLFLSSQLFSSQLFICFMSCGSPFHTFDLKHVRPLHLVLGFVGTFRSSFVSLLHIFICCSLLYPQTTLSMWFWWEAIKEGLINFSLIWSDDDLFTMLYVSIMIHIFICCSLLYPQTTLSMWFCDFVCSCERPSSADKHLTTEAKHIRCLVGLAWQVRKAQNIWFHI